ncbi:MAG: ATP-binding protein [Alphaproteobacteria bacterium]|nr:ATP-binding protein [Alphaproteobacteria bacterium]
MVIILAASLALQLAAAVVACAAIASSGRRLAWLLLACALVPIGVHRLNTLSEALAAPAAFSLDLSAELSAMAISVLLLLAVLGRRWIFRDSIKDSAYTARERMRYQDIAEAASDWLWETDEQHRYIWFSGRVEEITKSPREWYYGKSRIEIGQPKEPNEAWQDHLAKLAAREPFRDVEIHLVTPTGDYWVRSSGVPIFDDSGRFRGYRGTGTDITDWKRAEQSYAAVRDQLGKAIKTMSEGIAIFGPDDRLILCNEQMRRHTPAIADKIVPGVKFEDLIDLFSRHVLPPEIGQEERAAWRAERLSLRGRTHASMEFQIKSGDWCRITDTRMEDGSTVIVRTDITELKQRQAELEQERNRAEEASSAKTEFLANMSHELRTPLNAIIGFADVMRGGPLSEVSDKFRSYAEDIALSGRHLLDLINDLLDMAKIETGKLTLVESDFEPAAELTDIVAMVRALLEAKRIRLVEDLGDLHKGLLIHADRRAFRQILINLLSNAVKFTPEEGTITLSASISGQDLEITVRDTGIGIEANEQERVFDRFAQVGDVMARDQYGTGIGLPLSRALAEAHGGRLHLDSAIGKGTTVTLHLPGRARIPPRLAYVRS